MHSCELITNLHAKKVLCHHTDHDGAKDFRLQTDCVSCNVIGGGKFSPEISEARGISPMSPDPLLSQVGSGHKTRG